MNYCTVDIHTQSGTISYVVECPECCDGSGPEKLAVMLASDDPMILRTADGNAIAVMGINAVAIEVAEVDTPGA